MDTSSSNRPDSIHGLLKTHMFEPFSNQEHTHPPVQPRAVRRGATAGCVQGNLEGPGFDVHYRCSMGHDAPSRTSESVIAPLRVHSHYTNRGVVTSLSRSCVTSSRRYSPASDSGLLTTQEHA